MSKEFFRNIKKIFSEISYRRLTSYGRTVEGIINCFLFYSEHSQYTLLLMKHSLKDIMTYYVNQNYDFAIR